MNVVDLCSGRSVLITTIDNTVQVGICNSDVTMDNPRYGSGLSVAISL